MNAIQGKICPRCGKTEGQIEFVGAFCVQCLAETRFSCSTPRKISLEYCASCGRARMGDWSAATDYNVTQWLLAKSKAKEVKPLKTRIQRFEDHWIASLVFVLQAGDKKIERECSTRINLVNTQCPECSRRSAGYYEAVIQVRRSSPATPQEKLARAAEKLRRKLEKTSFVSRVEEKKEGIDLYVGSAPAARSALEELSKGFEASKTLAGRKQGREVYRTTFCVRI